MKLCSIGCGEHAFSSHGPAQAKYAAAHPEVRLIACADLEPARARRYAERFGFAAVYGDALEMVERERPDAVALVVPPDVTARLAGPLLERGVPVLIEKPPGRTVEEVDGLIAAAGRARSGAPHQVAFNRRFAPLLRELRARLDAVPPVHHLHYEMTRVGRRDPDFSTTAVHGIDAVRFLAGSDYAHVRFRYQERPELGPGVANVLLDAAMESGATAQLAFCPVAGVVVERATVHAPGHTFFLRLPMWDAFDAPGRLQHLEDGRLDADLDGGAVSDGPSAWEQGGFYGEYVAFLDGLAGGRPSGPSLVESRQSVAVAEAMRLRKAEFRA